ncbi:efflux RND transporter periplasmic adaptor subunit [Haliea sp. E1-2-M8]|uniref:efflux RND transporter periplasmic adaptor subunit n=1 Tax=Haliea sp. E1-2-M8 TaxID=3064706 RepID=UPI00271D3DEE|nr:efflux RND transporter periplasmic adaptor subunit [Haliea sp. E1-2-M8]MDO8862221.1 efflux RND transporter periplasmic adaptor subunit [Haliea sp. E1-2-M8]
MNRMRTWLPALGAVVLLVLLVAWMAGLFSERLAPGLEQRRATGPEPVYTVESEEVPVTEPVSGSVEAKQATVISSRIMSRIQRIHVRAGDQVSEGQVLVELEKSDLEARAAQATDQINVVRARLTEAERNLQRAVELQGRGLLSMSDRDAAQANRDTLQAELHSAEQALAESRAALAYASILSPIAGRVVDRFAEPGDTAAPGSRLISLYNPLSLRVEAQVREQLALALDIGQPIPVSLPALDLHVEGAIEEIVPAAEPGSRSFLVKIRLPYDERLLPGMYARVLVPAGSEQRLYVPRALLAQVGQLWVVSVAGPEGPERRFLRLGREVTGGRVEVVSGLAPGDKVLPLE